MMAAEHLLVITSLLSTGLMIVRGFGLKPYDFALMSISAMSTGQLLLSSLV